MYGSLGRVFKFSMIGNKARRRLVHWHWQNLKFFSASAQAVLLCKSLFS
jgi:hypothetical protein